jgi:hypothetical protein
MLKQAKSLPARQRSALEAAFGLSDATTAPDIFLIGLATLNLLTASAARRPILLLADDVQWLDQPSNDVRVHLPQTELDPIVLLMAIGKNRPVFRIRTGCGIDCQGSTWRRRLL